MKINIAIIQTTIPNDIQKARNQIVPLIIDAAKAGAQFIATPEGSNILERDPIKFREHCPNIESETDSDFYGNLAKELGVFLLMGSLVFQRNGAKAVNRSILFAPNGNKIAHYDKIHLFDVNLGNGLELKESANYDAGNKAVLINTQIGKIGLSICYDIRFAHLYRKLCQNGAQILCIPSAFTVPTGRAHWETLLRARAIENGAFVIAPAQVGNHDDGRQTFGNSMIINPWGEIIARLDGENIGYAMAQINLDEVKDARQKIPAWNLNIDFDLEIL